MMYKRICLILLVLFFLPASAFGNSVTINFRLTISEKLTMDTPAEETVDEKADEAEEEMSEEYYEEVDYARGAAENAGKVLIRSIVAK